MNVHLEIKNKGIIQFDHVFVEKSDHCLKFLQNTNAELIQVKSLAAKDLMWVCYQYKLSKDFTYQDFWFLEDQHYQSIFDNCFYLQPNGIDLRVWSLIPDHQLLNQQYHIDYQKRIKTKIENKFGFISLSFDKIVNETVPLMDSQKLKIKNNKKISEFPCFSFASDEDVAFWFSQFSKQFSRKYKPPKPKLS
jgi:hypothetical protein